MIPINYQASLFFKNPIPRPDIFYYNNLQSIAALFESPITLPIPADPTQFPDDLPLIQASSKDNYNISIAKNRVNIIYAFPDEKSTPTNFENLISQVSTQLKGNVERIGLASQHFINFVSPATKIKDQYLKIRIDNLEEISIRYNTREFLGSFAINNISTIQNVDAKVNFHPQKGIIILKDINNIANSNLPNDFVHMFMTKYYPNIKKDAVEGLI